MSNGLLAGKRGLILNIANDRSIAWHIANNAIQAGAKCGFGFLPIEKMERRVRKAMEEGGFGSEWLHGCDVSSDESIQAFADAAKQNGFEKLDFVVHSVAYADRNYLAVGKFLSTPRETFRQALDVSAYSLIGLTRAMAPLMTDGGSIVAMTYLGSEKAVPGYNVMGVAKAALESTTRYLAYELGDRRIRVNAISAGPVRTLSAMAVGGIDEMFDHQARKAPLKRNIDGDEVGKTAVYLLSDLSSAVTGEIHYVDAGFRTVGL